MERDKMWLVNILSKAQTHSVLYISPRSLHGVISLYSAYCQEFFEKRPSFSHPCIPCSPLVSDKNNP